MSQNLRIVHLADIHWRGLSRRDEYIEVFTNFFTRMKEIKPDFIFIGGDIFHTKTQNISPEVIESLTWWFSELAKAAPTVITLGNHDGNLANRSRQDAITPIVGALNNPRLLLLKQSGVFPLIDPDGLKQYPNINWCNYSCFDEDGWADVKPLVTDMNIGMFHGSVRGSTTETGFNLEADVGLDFFADLDFAFLGDIHKTQFLAYRECDDGVPRPWIAYCGSAIQQSYGEDPDHGFLLWNIRTKTDFDVELITLPNPSQFVTLDWNESVDQVLQAAAKYPDGARFRVRAKGSIPQADWRFINSELQHRKQAREVVQHTVASDEAASTINSRVIYQVVSDLRDPKTHVQLLRDFYSDLPDDKWPRLIECAERYVRACTDDDETVRNVKWSLDKLEFNNTFGYGPDNIVDFAALHGITGIFAPNAMGKSSIIGTIMYALFNATDRGPMKNLHVVNIRQQYCNAVAHLTIDGQKHELKRATTKNYNKAGEVSAATTLNFRCIDDGITHTGEQRTVTEKKLRRVIGTPEDFMMTSLAAQGGLKAFIDEGATQRKAILTRFLDLDIFEQINELVKQDSALVKATVKDMPERNWDVERTKLNADIADLNTCMASDALELSSIRAELQQLQFKLSSYGDTSSLVSEADVKRIRDRIESLELKATTIANNTAIVVNKQEVTQHMLEQISRVQSSFRRDYYEEKLQQRAELVSWIDNVKSRLNEEQRILDSRKRSVLKLAEVPCGDSFPTCKYIRDSHVDKVELPTQQQLVSDLLNEISGKQVMLRNMHVDNADVKLRRFNRIIGRVTPLTLKLAKLDTLRSQLEHELADVQRYLEEAREHHREMKVKLGYGNASIELVRLRDDIDDLEQTIRRLEGNRIRTAQDVGRKEQLLSTLDIQQREYLDLAEQWRTYELLIKATSRRGIPSQILRHLIPTINDEIAKILGGMCDFTVELEIGEDTNAMDAYINYGDSRRIIELGSGMEKMMASIAIRVALINVSNLPKTDMLIIDEGFSELDEANIEACGQLLRSLTQWFRSIIIITHIDTLKDVVDNVVDITREGTNARVYMT